MSDEEENVILRSSEGHDFKVALRVAKMSNTIKDLVEDAGTQGEIPLPNVSSKILEKVVTDCNWHTANPAAVKAEGEEKTDEKRTDDIIPWDLEFCKVDQSTLFELILAANYLDIKDLLDLTCKTVANMIKGKTPEEIRTLFNIKNDFTPEEEEQVRKENEWCEER